MGNAIRLLEGRYAAVLLSNHGPVVSAADLASAVYASEELEETAKLFLLLKGHAVRPVPEDRIAELLR
jgi:ribulose-5-phosphate 4-epimerase/fuculose-1-phosphate aldolase